MSDFNGFKLFLSFVILIIRLFVPKKDIEDFINSAKTNVFRGKDGSFVFQVSFGTEDKKEEKCVGIAKTDRDILNMIAAGILFPRDKKGIDVIGTLFGPE